jgi:hypothetical protein
VIDANTLTIAMKETAMSWSKYKARANSNSGTGGGKYLRLKGDGDKAKIVVMGQPMERWAWKDDEGRVQNGVPERAKEHSDHWVSYMIPVYDTDHKIPAILDMSPGLFKDLCSFFEDFSEERIVLIKRVGLGKNTSWQVNNLSELTEAQLATIKREQPYDLREEGCVPMSPVPSPRQTGTPSPGADDEVPF